VKGGRGRKEGVRKRREELKFSRGRLISIGLTSSPDHPLDILPGDVKE
jgi:hypothetical protein